jgi:hypothetical protein
MKLKITSLLVAAFIFLTAIVAAVGARAANEAEVRAAVEQIFQDLKTKNYEALYDTLPATSRTHVTRERFASALRRTQDMYALDRIEIGKINLAGDFAVVDTTLYGNVANTEGKIVAQQYLVRETGKWRVATGDPATIKRFLAAHPAFGRKFQLRQPRIYVKRDGEWVEFSPPKRQPRGD